MPADNAEQKPRKATAQQAEQLKDTEQQREALNALVGKQIIQIIGVPDGLHKVQVRRLWDNHYRVNIFLGPDAASVKIANSYFLQADNEGNILTSTPTIVKKATLPRSPDATVKI